MQFRKSDMILIHYRWQDNNSGANTPFSGEPSRRSFDHLNGDQVLFMINYLGSFFENFTLQQARALENQIAYSLPLEVKSEISVMNWLRK
jgi:hypothetical protein